MLKSKLFSLHFHITTLFSVLILFCGLLVGWYSYTQISKSILHSGLRIFNESSLQVEEKLLNEGSQIRTMLNILTVSSLTSATNVQQKLSILPTLKAMLDGANNLNALFVAYDNNDFFLFRKITNNTYLKTLNAPQQSTYMLTIKNSEQTQHYFYDQNLHLLLQIDDPSYQLNTKSRPWYIKAKQTNKTIVTDAYIFYTSQELGITLAKFDHKNRAVVGADYHLSKLSNLLKSFSSYPNSESIIINKQGKVIAYQDEQLLFSKQGRFNRLKSIEEIPSPILKFVFDNYKNHQGNLQFTYNQQQWFAKISKMRTDSSMLLLQLVPADELLFDAYHLRNNAALITLFIIFLTLPIAWFFSKQLSTPIRKLTDELHFIKNFDFSHPIETTSIVKEINELIKVTSGMNETIRHFQDLSASLVGKQNFQQLLNKITLETNLLSHASGSLIFLAAKSKLFNLAFTRFEALTEQQNKQLNRQLKTISFTSKMLLQNNKNNFSQPLPEQFSTLLKNNLENQQPLTWHLLPLLNRSGDCIAILAVIDDQQALNKKGKQNFIQAIADFSALAIEGQLLLAEQKNLLESFIQLIASAIDSQSPYTGGHCTRVPVLTKMLSQAACCQSQGTFKAFSLTEEQWEELHIASWLHDCGKIITPEYIVDKATKLETIYDRIHELRMRFELLKEQAHKNYWQGIAEGGDKDKLNSQRNSLLEILDNEFTFIAECNIGGEFMSEDKIKRLNKIAQRTWTRTLDNQIGISPQERKRHHKKNNHLPIEEPLIADKHEHLIPREHAKLTEAGNEWGFNIITPQYRFNRGELHNLSIQRGTLTEEDRFIINGHMIHTIVMLSKLPFPKHLKDVPLIAGGHHEKMDGSGYPRAIKAEKLPITARIMVIADIFEALTASDRPYKERKTISQAIKIMSFMVKDKHIDEDLFQLFLESKVYLQYAEEYLLKEQIDEVNISQYL